MKKLLSVLMVMAMAVSMLAGCGAEAEAEGMKIAIVSSPSGVDDGSFNQNNYEGILAFIEANPDATVTPVKEETGDVAAAVQAVADIVADYDAIVCCGFQFAGIATIAQENPEVSFILVDSNPSDASGAEVAVDNIYAMTFKEQESGFCAGIAAAMETQSGKVAVVNGIAYPSNVNYQWGFESGVNYANKNLGTAAEIVELASYAGTDVTGANVGGNYVGNFNDEATVLEGLKVGALYGANLDDFGKGTLSLAAKYGTDIDKLTVALDFGMSTIFGTDKSTKMNYAVEVSTDDVVDNTTLYGKYEGSVAGEKTNKGKITVGAKIAL